MNVEGRTSFRRFTVAKTPYLDKHNDSLYSETAPQDAESRQNCAAFILRCKSISTIQRNKMRLLSGLTFLFSAL